MRAAFLLGGAVCLAVTGCRGQDLSRTLQPGQTWTYRVLAPPMRYVETVRATRNVPVAGANGVELVSGLGTSRLAWKNNVLYASKLGTTFYEPAIPLWSRAAMKHHGRAVAFGKTTPVAGNLTPPPDKSVELTINGQKLKLDEAVIVLSGGGPTREIRTWIHPTRGLVQQEERVNGRLRLQTQMLTTESLAQLEASPKVEPKSPE